MKKLLALVLALTLACSLSACTEAEISTFAGFEGGGSH